MLNFVVLSMITVCYEFILYCMVPLTSFLDQHPSDNLDLVTGLEWEDPLNTNRLSISENRRLTILLTKIAHTVRLRDIVLQPYFQDYELVCLQYYFILFSNGSHFLRCRKIVVRLH